MVAARDADDVAVLDRHGFVERGVVGIDALDAEAVGGIQAVVIGFLQIGDAGEVVLVMAVAGVGRLDFCSLSKNVPEIEVFSE